MPTDRTTRIAQEMKRELSVIIAQEVKDPRISAMTSVLKVDLTRDLKYAKVYISVYDTEEKKHETIDALTHAEGFIRRLVGERVEIRRLPTFQFVLDNSIDHSIRIAKLLKEIGAKGSNE